MVQVYTGDGKGKTTAALGEALRALGHGWKVLMIQFMKGDPNYGELRTAKQLPGFEIVQSGLPTFVKKGSPATEDIRLAREGFDKSEKALVDGQYRMVILDEINVAVDYGLLPLDLVLNLIKNCPKETELILTGRYAHQEIIKLADLVSEVREIKHPFHSGIEMREGIDY
jgi:cob(I)alamin adenosyltransferase